MIIYFRSHCSSKKTKDAYYLELFHGATIAFKDMALSILPHPDHFCERTTQTMKSA